MFGLFKNNTIKKLEKEYAALLAKGVEAQRNGKIDKFSEISSQADKVLKEIERIEEAQKNEK